MQRYNKNPEDFNKSLEKKKESEGRKFEKDLKKKATKSRKKFSKFNNGQNLMEYNKYDPSKAEVIVYPQVFARNDTEVEDEINKMNNYIEYMYMNQYDAKHRTFFIVQVNYYYFSATENEYCPAEIGIAKCSLINGVQEVYCAIMKPGLLRHYTSDAHALSEKTHKLLTNTKEIGSRMFDVKLYDDIYEFLSSNLEGNQLPPLFTLTDDNQMIVNSVFQQLAALKGHKENIFRIYLLEHLYQHLIQVVDPNFDLCEARCDLMKDPFEYETNTNCEFHRSSEGHTHCSGSIVKRWMFVICQRCCPLYKIEKIRGCHETDYENPLKNVKLVNLKIKDNRRKGSRSKTFSHCTSKDDYSNCTPKNDYSHHTAKNDDDWQTVRPKNLSHQTSKGGNWQFTPKYNDVPQGSLKKFFHQTSKGDNWQCTPKYKDVQQGPLKKFSQPTINPPINYPIRRSSSSIRKGSNNNSKKWINANEQHPQSKSNTDRPHNFTVTYHDAFETEPEPLTESTSDNDFEDDNEEDQLGWKPNISLTTSRFSDFFPDSRSDKKSTN